MFCDKCTPAKVSGYIMVPSREGQLGWYMRVVRGGGRRGALRDLREEVGGLGRQEGGSAPVIIPRGNILLSTFIPVGRYVNSHVVCVVVLMLSSRCTHNVKLVTWCVCVHACVCVCVCVRACVCVCVRVLTDLRTGGRHCQLLSVQTQWQPG